MRVCVNLVYTCTYYIRGFVNSCVASCYVILAYMRRPHYWFYKRKKWLHEGFSYSNCHQNCMIHLHVHMKCEVVQFQSSTME